jgi:hypothetical protein
MAYPDKQISREEFMTYSAPMILTILQRMSRPLKVEQFYKKLDENLSFEYSVRRLPTPTNFDDFYNSLLLYRKNFTDLFQFLAADNSKMVPECKNKPGGLIMLFLSKIPYEFGKNVHREMRDPKFADINLYVDAFCDYVRPLRDLALEAKSMKTLFSGTEYESRIKPTNQSASRFYHAKKSLNHMDYQDDNDSDRLENEYDSEVEQEISQPAAAMDVNTNVVSVISSERGRPTGDSAKQICYYKVDGKPCKFQPCPYNHNHADIHRARLEKVEMLNKLMTDNRGQLRVPPDRNIQNRGHQDRKKFGHVGGVPEVLPRTSQAEVHDPDQE